MDITPDTVRAAIHKDQHVKAIVMSLRYGPVMINVILARDVHFLAINDKY